MAIADVYESLSFSTSTFLLILMEGRQLSKKTNLLFMQEVAIYTHNYTKGTQKLLLQLINPPPSSITNT